MKQFVAANENYNNFSSDKSIELPYLAMLMDDSSIYCYTGGHWVRTSAEPANAIAVALEGAGVYCLDSAGSIYGWNNDPKNSKWTRDTGISGVSGISCDPDGSLWAVKQNGEIHLRKARFVGLGSGRLFKMDPWAKAAMNQPAPPTTLPVPVTPPAKGVWTYKVKKGDTLNEIVKDKYKVQGKKVIEGLVAEIVKMNKLPDADTIKAGNSLQMPPLSQ